LRFDISDSGFRKNLKSHLAPAKKEESTMTPTWICEVLDRQGVHYELLHRPEGFSPESLQSDEHGLGQSAAEVAIAVADGRLLELVMPADSWADLQKVRELVGCREVRLASAEELREHYPGCEPGTVPPLRFPPGSDVLMDSWVDVNSVIVFLAGSTHEAIRMPIDKWMQVVNPRIGSFSQPVEEPVTAAAD
jgi:Ala-tRNA(Pro) deacylase